jgi:4-diphosphocytidyl-2-C-methyl-D-erythritol kinase
VEFEIEKDAGLALAELADQGGAGSGKELEADFVAADARSKAIGPAEGFIGGIEVEGEDDLLGGDGHGGYHRRRKWLFKPACGAWNGGLKAMRLKSPAKVNLTLKVLGKRADGFHELETLMCPVGIYDGIELEAVADGGIQLEIEGADLPADESNLAWKAAALVKEVAGVTAGVRIRLEKRIPMGGGLAGGSGNAALVLAGVNRLWGAGLGVSDLKELAARMGSDIAFFLDGGPSLCTGRGEITCPVELEMDAEVLLLNPGFGVPTPWAYRAYAAAPGQGEEGRREWTWKREGKAVRFRLRNDLEPAVFGKYLWIAEAKAWLLRQPEVQEAMMSGSGATVFALVEPGSGDELAARARAYFGPKCWIQRAPLLTSPQPLWAD